MGMTTLLTLTAMFGSTRQNVPRVSYTSYLDIWMLTCILFVFSSMVEFVVVQFCIKSKRLRSAKVVEHLMRVAIPVLFIIFNIMYWTKLGLFWFEKEYSFKCILIYTNNKFSSFSVLRQQSRLLHQSIEIVFS